MKRYIQCNENSTQFTLADVKEALVDLRHHGCKLTVRNGSVCVSSYEGDVYYFARLSDILDHINEMPNCYLEDDILDVIDRVGESVGAHHAFEVSEMKQKVAELRDKYFES